MYLNKDQEREKSTKKAYEQTLRHNSLTPEEKRRDASLRALYGISLDEYNTIFQAQQGKCLICKRHQIEIGTRLYVDHDHITGKVRGLLCPSCNTAVGFIETHDIDQIIAYIGASRTHLGGNGADFSNPQAKNRSEARKIRENTK